MTITVKLFGPQAQMAGQRELVLDFPASQINCGELRAAMARCHSRLAPTLASSRFAINQSFATDADAIHPGDEVALIGLISGG